MSTEIEKIDQEVPEMYGFEESKSEDLVIPRIKVINALSPERVDGEATEGQLINSLTKEDVTGKKFIPVKQFYTNIKWNPDRSADPRILCRSFDGRIGNCDSGTLVCSVCKQNQFDNTKQGKEAQPLCTAYLNFLGFFEGDPMPVVLSFAKTNYNEGKKLLSIARSLRANIWNSTYVLEGKKVSKDKQTWYIIVPRLDEDSTDGDRKLAFSIFKSFEDMQKVQVDYEDVATQAAAADIDEEKVEI